LVHIRSTYVRLFVSAPYFVRRTKGFTQRFGNPWGRDHFEELGADGTRIILKWMSWNMMGAWN